MMSTVAAPCGGAMALIRVSLITAKELAGVVPKETPVAAVKPLPVMFTTVPPAVLPEVALRDVTAGAAAKEYVSRAANARAEVPPGVVTRTSQVPAAWGGVTAVINVS